MDSFSYIETNVWDLDTGPFKACHMYDIPFDFDDPDDPEDSEDSEGPPFINRIDLIFEHITLQFFAETRYDTLTYGCIKIKQPIAPDPKLKLITTPEIENCIANLHGKTILWAWLLTNNQGYQDAIQFEFHELDGPENHYPRIQIYCEASALNIFNLTQVNP
ncbi:hypothetical protein JD969_12305 [Planctomycetota bacterium]|nr:hypothetical protein JD969_12305 [Planctomycetota bacterium]